MSFSGEKFADLNTEASFTESRGSPDRYGNIEPEFGLKASGVDVTNSYATFLNEETACFLIKGTNVNIYSSKGERKVALLSTNP